MTSVASPYRDELDTSTRRRLMVRFAIRESVGVVFLGIVLFWPAGDLGWWPAWAVVIVTAAWASATGVVIVRNHPGLLAERLGPRRGAKLWDTVIMSLHGLLQVIILVVAGLDHRYGWTTGVWVGAQAAALVAFALSYALVVWATRANPFFSQIVRIQTERGHETVSSGPYRFVRHPAYSGGIVSQVSAPVLLASHWALAIGIADAFLFVLRTGLEDRTLMAELPGYVAYSERVRKRLIPGIW